MAQYGIIGKSLGHSFSPAFFKNFFCEKNLPHTYNLFEIPEIREVRTLINQNPDLKGFNVTIPYKKVIIPYLDYISEEASEVGAVNTVLIERLNEDITLRGYNTDIFGFDKTISQFNTNFRKALILGTGGASMAVAYVLKLNNIEYRYVSRVPKAEQYSYDELNPATCIGIDLIINTTPVGMYPEINHMPDIPISMFYNGVTAIDLIYNPDKTLFLRRAETEGCKIANGLLMLEQQAIKAWEIWSA